MLQTYYYYYYNALSIIIKWNITIAVKAVKRNEFKILKKFNISVSSFVLIEDNLSFLSLDQPKCLLCLLFQIRKGNRCQGTLPNMAYFDSQKANKCNVSFISVL